MNRRKTMNLVAVAAAVVFILVYTLPSLQNAAAVDACIEQGGQYDPSADVCVLGAAD